jgi:hypothetical protein
MQSQQVTYWAPSFDGFFPPQQFFGEVHQDSSGLAVTLAPSIMEGGYMLLGLSLKDDPKEVPEARKIVEVGESTDIRFLRKVNVAILSQPITHS